MQGCAGRHAIYKYQPTVPTCQINLWCYHIPITRPDLSNKYTIDEYINEYIELNH